MTAVVVGGSLALAAAPAHAQAPEPEAPNQLQLVKVDTSGYPTIDVVVALPLPDERPPVPESAYDVLIGSTRREFSGTYLGSEGVEVAIVVDAGTAQQLQGLREIAAALMRRLPAGTSISLVQSGDPATVVEPLNDNPQVITNALDGLTVPPAGGRSTTAAVSTAVGTLSRAIATRPAVVVLTAAPQGDAGSAADLAVAASRRQYPIHVLALGSGDMPAVVNPLRLSKGLSVVSESADGFVAPLDQIAAASSDHYRLVFTVQRATPERVLVRVAAQGVSGEQEVAVDPPPGALQSSDGRRRGAAGQVANQLFPVIPVAAAGAGALIVFLGSYWRRRRRGSWG